MPAGKTRKGTLTGSFPQAVEKFFFDSLRKFSEPVRSSENLLIAHERHP
jgi:hypothetical protein